VQKANVGSYRFSIISLPSPFQIIVRMGCCDKHPHNEVKLSNGSLRTKKYHSLQHNHQLGALTSLGGLGTANNTMETVNGVLQMIFSIPESGLGIQ